jgi:hypothetical protein
MLARHEPITVASANLPIADIVRGLNHIWTATKALDQKALNQDGLETPASALVAAGVTASLDVARQLLDTYVGAESSPEDAFDELDAIIAQGSAKHG